MGALRGIAPASCVLQSLEFRKEAGSDDCLFANALTTTQKQKLSCAGSHDVIRTE